jgi:hypothetical protein
MIPDPPSFIEGERYRGTCAPKGCNSENGTGRHGPSIQSGLTKLYNFLICLRYIGRLLRYEIWCPLLSWGPRNRWRHKTGKKSARRNFLHLVMLLALYLCVFLGLRKSFLTDILCTYGQNNAIYHIKKITWVLCLWELTQMHYLSCRLYIFAFLRKIHFSSLEFVCWLTLKQKWDIILTMMEFEQTI